MRLTIPHPYQIVYESLVSLFEFYIENFGFLLVHKLMHSGGHQRMIFEQLKSINFNHLIINECDFGARRPQPIPLKSIVIQ